MGGPKARAVPPPFVNHNERAALLEKFGLDPGKLAEKAAERGLSSL